MRGPKHVKMEKMNFLGEREGHNQLKDGEGKIATYLDFL
jgi:hypothetical protein